MPRLFAAAKVSETMTDPRLSVSIHRASSLTPWESGNPRECGEKGSPLPLRPETFAYLSFPASVFIVRNSASLVVLLVADQDENAKSV